MRAHKFGVELLKEHEGRSVFVWVLSSDMNTLSPERLTLPFKYLPLLVFGKMYCYMGESGHDKLL